MCGVRGALGELRFGLREKSKCEKERDSDYYCSRALLSGLELRLEWGVVRAAGVLLPTAGCVGLAWVVYCVELGVSRTEEDIRQEAQDAMRLRLISLLHFLGTVLMEGVGLEGKKPQRCASSNDHTFSRCFRALFVKPSLLFRSVREPRCIAQMWLFFTPRVESRA